MAKDGTNRGGARPGAGHPRKALADKIASGNPGGRALTQIKVPDNLPDLIGEDMPQPSEILSAQQKKWKATRCRQNLQRYLAMAKRLQV